MKQEGEGGKRRKGKKKGRKKEGEKSFSVHLSERQPRRPLKVRAKPEKEGIEEERGKKGNAPLSPFSQFLRRRGKRKNSERKEKKKGGRKLPSGAKGPALE